MAIQTRTVLKTYFNTGDKPTETQFVDLIDSSLNLTDGETLSMGGTPFTKTDIDNLKAGKSIATDPDKKFVNSADATTYIRMSQAGKAWHYVGDKPIFKLAYAAETGVINIGETTTTVNLDGATKLSAGAGNPNTITTTFTIPDNMNYQLIGPKVSVSSSISVGEGSLLYITQP